MKETATASVMALVAPSLALSGSDDRGQQIADWQRLLKDPVRDLVTGTPDLDRILGLFPRQQGNPAVDPRVIRANSERLKTVPEIDTGHAFLNLSIRTGLAHIDATFQGDHPKYGVGRYSEIDCDGFPPTIIAVVDALSAWGMNRRAGELLRYWLTTFVRDDGTIDYYGPSISEYGQLLHTAALLEERAGGDGWLAEASPGLDRIAEYLLRLRSSAEREDGLIAGVPEADTRDQIAKYFHNNAWVVKGLERWAGLCEKTGASPTTPIGPVREAAARLRQSTLSAIRSTWPADPSDWWLPARLGTTPRPTCLTDGSEASFTNYRYWPELLSSGILPVEMANRLVDARLAGGGQFCGMTRFMGWLDDWPLANHLYALWSLGRHDDFLLSLYGHVAYHQCEGHLTAFEQINFPGDPQGSKRADYCLPSQLVAARAGRLLNRS